MCLITVVDIIYSPTSAICREGPHAQGILTKRLAHAKHLPDFGTSQTAGDRRNGSRVGVSKALCLKSKSDDVYILDNLLLKGIKK
jgi:hypothetical protein